MNGVIKMVNREKGFGFIKPDKGEDLFFGSRGLDPELFAKLDKDVRVSFDVGESPKGPMAINLKLAA